MTSTHFIVGYQRDKSGARVSFPASTGTKGSSQLITFIGMDGAPVVYYGIAFTEPAE